MVGDIAVIHSDIPVIIDTQSVLDLAAEIGAERGVNKIIVEKSAVCEDFFHLSTGIAGEVVQKFVTYGFHLAIVGDFSGYPSRALHDYIRECNRGRHLYFAADEAAAVKKLGGAPDGIRT